MPKSSLRQLFTEMKDYHKADISSRVYALFEALVEVVEPQECPQGCDATIRKLRLELAEAKAEQERLYDELTAALTEIPKLENQRDKAKTRVRYLEIEHNRIQTRNGRNLQRLTEAKAEINRQQAIVRRLTKMKAGLYEELEEAHEEFESYTKSINADAEIGRLVRGMPLGTRLLKRRMRGSKVYFPQIQDDKWEWGGVAPFRYFGTADPAEALRAIQEMGDE